MHHKASNGICCEYSVKSSSHRVRVGVCGGRPPVGAGDALKRPFVGYLLIAFIGMFHASPLSCGMCMDRNNCLKASTLGQMNSVTPGEFKMAWSVWKVRQPGRLLYALLSLRSQSRIPSFVEAPSTWCYHTPLVAFNNVLFFQFVVPIYLLLLTFEISWVAKVIQRNVEY